MTERIPREILDAAVRRLQRHVAAVIIQGMADVDVSFEEMDDRLGKREGWSRKHIVGLIVGKTLSLRTVSDLFFALGAEPQFTVRQVKP